jgi:hypothetical protein
MLLSYLESPLPAGHPKRLKTHSTAALIAGTEKIVTFDQNCVQNIEDYDY